MMLEKGLAWVRYCYNGLAMSCLFELGLWEYGKLMID